MRINKQQLANNFQYNFKNGGDKDYVQKAFHINRRHNSLKQVQKVDNEEKKYVPELTSFSLLDEIKKWVNYSIDESIQKDNKIC